MRGRYQEGIIQTWYRTQTQSPPSNNPRGFPICHSIHLSTSHDTRNSLLHVRPFRLSWYGHIPYVIHIQLSIASTQSGTPSVFPIPLQLVDRTT
jgi:hypothetical protein